MFRWIRSRFALRRLTLNQRALKRWERVARRKERSVRNHLRELRSVKTLVESITNAALEDVEELERISKEQDVLVEKLRNENELYKNILVPELTAAHRLILERIDADIATQVRLRTSNVKRREE